VSNRDYRYALVRDPVVYHGNGCSIGSSTIVRVLRSGASQRSRDGGMSRASINKRRRHAKKHGRGK
jgi:hypothetical protein